jgi:hypothetical protein
MNSHHAPNYKNTKGGGGEVYFTTVFQVALFFLNKMVVLNDYNINLYLIMQWGCATLNVFTLGFKYFLQHPVLE